MFRGREADLDGMPLFWLELFDHLTQTSVDGFRSEKIEDAAVVFEDFMSQGADLNTSPYEFDPLAVALDWLDACRRRDLDSLLDLCDERATLECDCEAVVLTGRQSLSAYWAPKLESKLPAAFTLDNIMPTGDGVQVEYQSCEGKPVRIHFRFTPSGKIARASCDPLDRRCAVVASTTSTQDSGLFEYLFPIFQQKTGIGGKVIAQGTGQALDTGRRGDADVVFVHAKSAEEKFLAEGEGVKRYPVMYNDFVLIGPKSDPAGIKGTKDVARAFRQIKDKQAPFISRGDRSGTHIAELALWNKDARIDIEKERGPWYKSIGQGMGPALNMASANRGYVLSDRGTWISFENKSNLQILVEDDKRLFNQYGVMLVNPTKHPNVRKDLGQQLIDWLVSADGQNAITDYKINGEQLFYPNAGDPNA
jgi:tungstate transport system substrate-binding protein